MQILSPKYEELRKSIEIQSIINCFPTLSLGAKSFRSMCTSRSDFESVRILSSRRKRKPSLHMPLQIIIQYFLITYIHQRGQIFNFGFSSQRLPCPPIDPKLIWTHPNCFGHVQFGLDDQSYINIKQTKQPNNLT